MTEILFARKTDVDTITAGAFRYDIPQTLTVGQLTQVRANLSAGDITKVNDTNVTLTLGGTPTSSVLQSVSFTLGWSGTLAAARLNSNVVQAITNDTNVIGTIATQTLTLGWSGTLAVARGGTGGGTASGTLLDNITGFSSTGLLARTAAGTYAFRTVTGTSNRLTVTNGDGVSGNPTLDISTSYVGQATITTLGTIATGVWNGTKVGLAYGGTNADLSATGGTSQVLKQVTAGANVTVGQLAASDLSNSTSGSGAVALVSSPSFTTPALGTPSAAVLTNATGLPVASGISGLGTGVATALAVNTGSAGAVVLFNGAGGTPSSMTATNLTGTASGLTAGTVTTNANLTGVITSVGNATSIASQTGTGTTFVMSASPTITGTITATAANFSGTITFGTGTITALTTKASPNSTDDYIIIYDAAGTAIKKTTVGAVGAAGSVASFNSRAGAVVPVQGDYPTSLINGTATNDNATAGNIGEYISSDIIAGSAVSLTSTTNANLTSISLTAGDWDVSMSARFTGGATTQLSYTIASISTTSATLDGTVGRRNDNYYGGAVVFASIDVNNRVSTVRFSLASTTTIYAVVNAAFLISTASAYGTLWARRVR